MDCDIVTRVGRFGPPRQSNLWNLAGAHPALLFILASNMLPLPRSKTPLRLLGSLLFLLGGVSCSSAPDGDRSGSSRPNIIFVMTDDHYRSVQSIDEGLGQILDYLDDYKLAEDTLIIYTTDNDFYMGEYGCYGKRFIYEPSLVLILDRKRKNSNPPKVIS